MPQSSLESILRPIAKVSSVRHARTECVVARIDGELWECDSLTGTEGLTRHAQVEWFAHLAVVLYIAWGYFTIRASLPTPSEFWRICIVVYAPVVGFYVYYLAGMAHIESDRGEIRRTHLLWMVGAPGHRWSSQGARLLVTDRHRWRWTRCELHGLDGSTRKLWIRDDELGDLVGNWIGGSDRER